MSSKGFIAIKNMREQALDSPSASGWWSGMGDESGSNRNPEKGRPSSLPSPDPTHSSSPPRLILLVAEDNLPDAIIVREAIKKEKLPVEVFIAADGEKALEFFQRAESDATAPAPSALLLDLNLPKVDGFEVLRAIRASRQFKELPILIVTSSDSPSDRSEAARLGAGYFRKPVTYAEFLKIGVSIRELLRENKLL